MGSISYLIRKNTKIIGGHLLENTTTNKQYYVVGMQAGTCYIMDDSKKELAISVNCRLKHFKWLHG